LVKAKFEYTGIRVRNLDRSIGFYIEKLGMKLMGRNKINETHGETADLMSPEGNQKLELD
jgi:catechol 2,3-dioxygenase-like lactoylglutathione lyase family enzyme